MADDAVTALTPEQIKHMVDRFLMWRLPEHFNPDCGISFEPFYNGGLSGPSRREPVGTNLFDAQQAEAMVRHMVERLPLTPIAPIQPATERAEIVRELRHAYGRGTVGADNENYQTSVVLSLLRRAADALEATPIQPVQGELRERIEKVISDMANVDPAVNEHAARIANAIVSDLAARG